MFSMPYAYFVQLLSPRLSFRLQSTVPSQVSIWVAEHGPMGSLLINYNVFLDPSISDRQNVKHPADLRKCEQMLNWRHEKIQQLESSNTANKTIGESAFEFCISCVFYYSELESVSSKLKTSQNSYGECRWSLTDCQERSQKCAEC